jgi:hypothetical protein
MAELPPAVAASSLAAEIAKFASVAPITEAAEALAMDAWMSGASARMDLLKPYE